MVAFDILEEDVEDLVGHQRIYCHMFLDVNIDLT